MEPESSSRGSRRPGDAGYLLAAPGGRLDHPKSVSDPTLACYLPFGAEIFAIYFPGSSRLCILRFCAFSFRSVCARGTFSKPRCHGFPKIPQGQVLHQRHQLLPHRGKETPSNTFGGGWCPPQRRFEGTCQGGEFQV